MNDIHDESEDSTESDEHTGSRTASSHGVLVGLGILAAVLAAIAIFVALRSDETGPPTTTQPTSVDSTVEQADSSEPSTTAAGDHGARDATEGGEPVGEDLPDGAEPTGTRSQATDECSTAFRVAADAVDELEENLEELALAFTACESYSDFAAADPLHPDALYGVDPELYARNQCRTNSELAESPVCTSLP